MFVGKGMVYGIQGMSDAQILVWTIPTATVLNKKAPDRLCPVRSDVKREHRLNGRPTFMCSFQKPPTYPLFLFC